MRRKLLPPPEYCLSMQCIRQMASPMPSTAPHHTLHSKKRTALLLLVAAFALFVLGTGLEHRFPHWGWLALVAFAEAALVGGLADWFAVVALFRRPMGIRIPHTGIIPAKKDRIGAALADFVRDHFLGREQIVEKIRALGPADWLARALSAPSNAEACAACVVRLLPRALDQLDSEALRQQLRATLIEQGSKVDVSTLTGQIAGYLASDTKRQQQALDGLLRLVAEELRKPSLREGLTDKVSNELGSFLRTIKMDRLIAEPVANKIANGALGQIDDILTRPQHPLRARVVQHLQTLAKDLHNDAALRAELEQTRDQLLRSDALANYTHALWQDLLAWLRKDLADEDSAIHRQVKTKLLGIGAWLSARDDLRQRLDAWCVNATAPLVDEYREKARDYIADRVRQWSAEEMTTQIELGIGTDLQYIRYNGTLIGGLIGLFLFACLEGIQFLMAIIG